MAIKPRNLKTLQVQRPLSDSEREWYLPIDQAVGKTHASAMVIRMNSTYLELVDGYYTNRGTGGVFGLFGIAVCVCLIVADVYFTVRDYFNPNWDHHEDIQMFISSAFVWTISFLLVALLTFLNKQMGEWFGYTHYPIRLNRRSRMVYVFRGDGTVLEASWDKTHFALYVVKNIGGIRWLGICGLVMKDADTVEEQFMFGYNSSDETNCRRHWEFMRRYMEDGPQSVLHADGTGYYLPIADKRETLGQGWITLVSNYASNPILKWVMMPFCMLFFIGRLAWRVTSKVPLWPADVEAACRIDPHDPYVRDSRTNPEEYQ